MTDVYAVVDVLAGQDAPPTSVVCDVLGVSRSAYYAWRVAEPTSRQCQDGELTPVVRAVFWKHRRRYGARRIAEELADQGLTCGVRRVAKLLKNQGLRAIQPQSFRPKTTDSRHRLGYSPNLLLEAAEPSRVNQLWVGDITYVPLKGRSFCYLALLMDRYSRYVVGWNLGETMTEELVIAALHRAIGRRQPSPGLIHHTDRGGQYASRRYRAILRRAGMRQSMNRAANCYDNAFLESCFGTIKTELEMTDYQHQSAARQEIATYLAYYNQIRKHSSLDYYSPHQFEACQDGTK